MKERTGNQVKVPAMAGPLLAAFRWIARRVSCSGMYANEETGVGVSGYTALLTAMDMGAAMMQAVYKERGLMSKGT
jgi:hypothetical protein